MAPRPRPHVAPPKRTTSASRTAVSNGPSRRPRRAIPAGLWQCSARTSKFPGTSALGGRCGARRASKPPRRS
eukprot:9289427-Lingulodinium_polyedra.AAC.1